MDSHRDVIERVMTEGMAPGVVILVGRGGKTVLHEAFGRARTNPDVPMRPDAVFDMASVTKAVAATAACAVCIDDGRLALDALLGGGTRDGVRVLSPAALALFEHRLNQPPHRPRSFGWDVAPELRPTNLSGRTYYHTGWTGQSLYVDPGSNAYAIILTNRTGDHDRARFQRRVIAEAALATGSRS
ncbi:MAG: hypothetical protein A3K19_29965 [Lentisphaerae bacterium RIFOXYB12_FULL_65_16]|nr:MAG: hypothetical protein A3K18_33575 [Lentisphaerae bacterium RIFOXYA12_64_32]OGV86551.1 MAG: hypothetical protein A3K19_29965 [Lentisphaerae bacterium RIFOXYB12_FULL_65_16]